MNLFTAQHLPYNPRKEKHFKVSDMGKKSMFFKLRAVEGNVQIGVLSKISKYFYKKMSRT